MDYTAAVLFLIFSLIFWGFLAGVMTPLVRNIVAIVPTVTALILAVALLVLLTPGIGRYLLALFAVPWAISFLREWFPLKPGVLETRRAEVTFLQDTLFWTGIFVTMIELMVLIDFFQST